MAVKPRTVGAGAPRRHLGDEIGVDLLTLFHYPTFFGEDYHMSLHDGYEGKTVGLRWSSRTKGRRSRGCG